MRRPAPRRKIDERALRRECADLRYMSVFGSLSTLDDPALETVLRRTRAALDDLERVIYAHDDSPARLFFATLGGAAAAISLATMSGPIGVLAAIAGAAVAMRDGAALARTLQHLSSDEELFVALAGFVDQIAAEFERRGLRGR